MSLAKDDAMLRRLLQEPATFARAQSLISIVRQKTAPGSGYDLRDGKTALVPICALIASEMTKNHEFTIEAAINASFVNSKIFNTTLATIRAVVKQNTRTTTAGGRESPPATFLSLAQRYGGEECTAEMEKVYTDFLFQMQNHGMYNEAIWDKKRRLIMCSIYWWTCSVLGVPVKDKRHLIEQYQLKLGQFTEAIDTLDLYCAKTSRELRDRLLDMEEQPSPEPVAGPSNPSRGELPNTPSNSHVPPTPSKHTRSLLEKRDTALYPTIAQAVPRTPTTQRINPVLPRSGSKSSARSSGTGGLVTPTPKRKPLADTELDESEVPTPTQSRVVLSTRQTDAVEKSHRKPQTGTPRKVGRPPAASRSRAASPEHEPPLQSRRSRPIAAFMDRDFYYVLDEKGEEKIQQWEIWRAKMGMLSCETA
ncbi:hypothetical protein BOTBODRAFT_61983 [Botryobasidium botryosum FD-172 SS1]|uniref:Origin recognition complex subunit 6 n=1 Tax=Botryobasidium botryosum (strain FD-172 SS1) TaxID=930990 RepID=A0A067N1V3_BOTB1|nr:hypothetical protein BOTBODRAFT_61983 [Botryobasidium botryosum FD-172 SS1]